MGDHEAILPVMPPTPFAAVATSHTAIKAGPKDHNACAAGKNHMRDATSASTATRPAGRATRRIRSAQLSRVAIASSDPRPSESKHANGDTHRAPSLQPHANATPRNVGLNAIIPTVI